MEEISNHRSHRPALNMNSAVAGVAFRAQRQSGPACLHCPFLLSQVREMHLTSVQLTRIPLGTNGALGPNLPLGPDRKSNKRMEMLHKQGLHQSFTANEGIILVPFSSLLKTTC